MAYKLRFKIAAFLTIACILPLCGADKSTTPRFEKDILAFEAADKKSPPPEGAVLFTGASQFTRWKTMQQDLPEYKVINRGFGGSQMSDLVRYTERIVIPYKPKQIVIQEGGNDLHAGKTPEQVLADFKAFVEKVRAALPEARISFSGLTPSPARWAEAGKQKKLNELLKEYAASEKNLDFIDLFDAYLGPDGKPPEDLFVKDRLHQTPAGYKIRIALTKPHLN